MFVFYLEEGNTVAKKKGKKGKKANNPSNTAN